MACFAEEPLRLSNDNDCLLAPFWTDFPRVERNRDHHVWHLTYAQLTQLISDRGFVIDKVYWEKGFGETVCYIRGRKRSGLARLVML